jgi:Ca2+:H+ antiporter
LAFGTAADLYLWCVANVQIATIALTMLASAKEGRALGNVSARTPWWAWTWPVLAWLILIVTAVAGAGSLILIVAGAVLIATVFAAVHHAEVVAHRTGEPFGTLVLAVAVTVIEVALIVSVMLAAPAENSALARDTVFAAVMIVCNGIVGLCLLAGGARYG